MFAVITTEELLAVAFGKSTHQLRLFYGFSFQSHLHFHGRRAGRKVKLLAQGVQTREITMTPRRRTRSGVTEFAGVVLALQTRIGDWRLFGKIFSDACDVGWDIVEKPVSKTVVAGASGS